ncbi:hypothetical protein [Streptomyces sp. NPDC051546]|uniref:hypothetical protein n=1 Tax=Streptomyces sp. NPDC051546 TaxID=3365655 RepID=UPI0037B5AE23
MPPQNAPRWDPATQRWVTDPAEPPPAQPTPPAPPAPTQGPPAQPTPPAPPAQNPAPPAQPGPPAQPAPPPGYEPAPGPPPAPGSAPGHDPGAASGPGTAPGYDPASGPAPAPAAAPAPAPGYEPAPQPGPGEYGPGGYGPAGSEQDGYRYPYPTYPHPQPVQQAYPVPPPPPRAGGRWLTPTTAAVAVAALALGAAAVWFVARDTGEQPAQAGPTASGPVSSAEGSPTPSATRSSPSPTDSGSPTPTPSPSGSDPAHETVRDAKGFTVAVPTGWLREEAASGVFYRSPDRTALIQVFQVSEPELTPLAAVQGASTYLRAQTTGYQEIRVGPAPDAPEGGELVYEYDSAESHGRRRGVERVFVAGDGRKWAVLTAGPAPDWTLTQAHHEAALTAFRPTGG